MVLTVSDEPLVRLDYIGSLQSSTVDASSTTVVGWYPGRTSRPGTDNEMGYRPGACASAEIRRVEVKRTLESLEKALSRAGALRPGGLQPSHQDGVVTDDTRRRAASLPSSISATKAPGGAPRPRPA